MAKFEIFGGKPLSGEIYVSGSKNSAIKLIAASCMIRGTTRLSNVPKILDIEKILEIIGNLGAKYRWDKNALEIDATNLEPKDPDPKLVGSIRASITLVGPLLARFGKLKIPHPGGCSIGKRPIDLHIKAFTDLGCKVTEKDKFFYFEIPQKLESLKDYVSFSKISNGATENILMFCAAMEKETRIDNVAVEPEIIDLIDFLNKSGAKISQNNRSLTVFGSRNLNPISYNVIPDRIEAGTYIVLSALSGGNIEVKNCRPDHLESLFTALDEMGFNIIKTENSIKVRLRNKILPAEISTAPYPDFATDLQPPVGLLMTKAEGKSEISENLFENRLGYLEELQKMGADIKIIDSRHAEINGPTLLCGADINSLDLRAGATLLLAGLIAEGKTIIEEAENIDRGYEAIEEKLSKIGADIKRKL